MDKRFLDDARIALLEYDVVVKEAELSVAQNELAMAKAQRLLRDTEGT